MFRDRPLTALLIAATFVVNGVLFVTLDSFEDSPAAIGLVLGQLAAMAIWSVRGRTHRLARASYLVLATWGLFCLLPEDDHVWFSFLSGYAFIIVVVTLLADYLHVRFQRNLESMELKSRWQISLVECFGWTIVASIISFGARSMDFQIFLKLRAVWKVVALLSVPLVFSFFVRRDLRDLKVVQAICITIVTVIAARSFVPDGLGGEYAVGIQTAYLTLWLAVLGMDDVFVKMKKVRHLLGKKALPAEVPESFDLEA